MSIVIGILLFMILVIIHELGHFLAARKSGVHVYEFGIGIPPKMKTLRKDKKNTDYTINAIPLGWFVRIKGENPDNPEEFSAKDSFHQAKFLNKIMILIGGVFMNLLLAYIVFSVSFMIGVKPPLGPIPDNITSLETKSYLLPTFNALLEQGRVSWDIQKTFAKVEIVMSGLLADQIGLISWDIILRVGDDEVNNFTITRALKRKIGQTFDLVIQRNNETLTKTVTCPVDQCLLGIAMQNSSEVEILPWKMWFWQAWVAGWQEIYAQTVITFDALGTLFANLISFDSKRASAQLDKMSWPVCAVKIGDTILHQQSTPWVSMGITELIVFFGGMISLALALFNILPIPALDGWRLLWVVIQTLFRIRPEKYFSIEWYVNTVSFLVLMVLGIYIIFKDLVRCRGITIPFLG